MIAIANTSARLEAFCGSAVTTDIKFTVGYFNMPQQSSSNQQAQLATTIPTVSNGVTDVQIAPYPGQNAISSSITTGTGAVQVIQYIKAHNTNASSVTVTIQINDGNDDIQWKGTIPAGGTAYCDNEARWYVLDADGALVTSIGIFPSKPAFLAYNSTTDTNQTGNGAVAVVDFDTEVFDTQGNFSADTFTAPVTGKYLLQCAVSMTGITSAMTNRIIQLLTSNRTYQSQNVFAVTPDGSSQERQAISVTADMDAGDTAVVRCVISNGAGDTASIQGSSTLVTYFSGVQVG